MKKALSVLLSMLLIFSMVGVMAFAAEGDETDLVKVVFQNYDGTVIKEIEVAPGTILTAYIPENPERIDPEGEYKYTFKGWKDADGKYWYKNSTFPTPDGSQAEIFYTADYTSEHIGGFQSLWNLIESIFARINLIFQYFAKIFQW